MALTASSITRKKKIPALPGVLSHVFLPADTTHFSVLIPDLSGGGRATLGDHRPHWWKDNGLVSRQPVSSLALPPTWVCLWDSPPRAGSQSTKWGSLTEKNSEDPSSLIAETAAAQRWNECGLTAGTLPLGLDEWKARESSCSWGQWVPHPQLGR